MVKKIYTVFDQAAKAYLPPFFARSHGEAIRMFSNAVNGSDTLFTNHPEDFTLYYIGSFSEETGIVLGDNHQSLGNAVEFVNHPPPSQPEVVA